MQNERVKKNIVQDVVPPKRSIRNVELPSRRRHKEDISFPSPKINRRPTNLRQDKIELESEENNKEEEVTNISYKYEYDKPVKTSRKGFYIAIGVLVVVVAFGISSFFRNASVFITPRNQVVKLDVSFLAKKDDAGKGLTYQIVTVTKNIEKVIPSTEEEKVDRRASGRIVIFNNYSTKPQNLIATTRFETPEGLVYRIKSGVTVPGTYVKNGKTIPGSVEVIAEADVTGDKYNIDLKDFVLPGFKGDPRYTQIYARSKTAMTGGFSGMQKVVSQSAITNSDSGMVTELKSILEKDIISQIPENFVLYKEGISFSLSEVEQIGSNESGVVLKKSGTAYAVIFDRGIISRNIISKILPESVDDSIKIKNLDQLNFVYKDIKLKDSLSDAVELEFILSGNPEFVWVLDENKFKSNILGLSKGEVRNMAKNYGNIVEVSVETAPFWNQKIPLDPNKVKIVNTIMQ